LAIDPLCWQQLGLVQDLQPSPCDDVDNLQGSQLRCLQLQLTIWLT
jgi:hypothetical protein